MRMYLDPSSASDYLTFVKAKALPGFQCIGNAIDIPDEYAGMLGVQEEKAPADLPPYRPIKGLFDYQRGVTRLAIRKRKFAAFVACGYGKTLILLEYARYVASVLPKGKRVLMVAPLMVVKQTIREAERWYGSKLQLERIEARDLSAWMLGEWGGQVGITNYEALKEDTPQGCLGALIPDESGCMKGAYGTWAEILIRLGTGLEWKLCATGTPAPNDRIEFANHAVFLDAFPTVNSFLARYFINRGQTQERWELKPHAIQPFYRDLSRWCIFLENPATYGFRDNCGTIPPIEVHIHDVEMSQEQHEAVYNLTGKLFLDEAGGITKRAKLSQIAKGRHNGAEIETRKPAFIKSLVDSWPDESTILWCKFNEEQAGMERLFPEAGSIAGATPMPERERLIEEFQDGRRKILISKPDCLGWGINLQRCTRMIFSTLQDSWEEFHQAVKRANRVGSSKPLRVHLPLTEIERPMANTVWRKAKRIQADNEEQEKVFKNCGVLQWN